MSNTLDLAVFRKLEFDHLANLSGLGATRRGVLFDKASKSQR